MKQLNIDKVEGYNYQLSSNDRIYNLNIEFYGLPNSNDIQKIYIYEEILGNNNVLSFGLLDDKCGRTIKSKDDVDLIIVIMKDGKKYLLKRLYG